MNPMNPYHPDHGDEPMAEIWDAGFAAGRAAASPDPPAAADLVAAHLRERWPCTCRPGMDGGGVYHAADCNSRREGSQAVLAVIRLLRAANPPASPDERLREALRDANEYLAQIADYSPSEVADAIDSVRAQIKDALAATDSRGKPDGASVPDQSCATCGGSGDRNGNRRAADPFGTCPGCGGTGNVAAADREAPDEPTGCCRVCGGSGHVGGGCHGCAPPVSDEPKEKP